MFLFSLEMLIDWSAMKLDGKNLANGPLNSTQKLKFKGMKWTHFLQMFVEVIYS